MEIIKCPHCNESKGFSFIKSFIQEDAKIIKPRLTAIICKNEGCGKLVGFTDENLWQELQGIKQLLIEQSSGK